jgi:hypothetical protein
MNPPKELWSWVVHLIKENRPVWLANGVEVGPADRIDIAATVTRDGNTVSISGMSSAAAHGIVSASHTASGLTTGHVLQAATATTFEFAAITDAMIPSTIARDTEVTSAVGTAISDHVGEADPHTQYLTAGEANTFTPFGANDTVLTADNTQPEGWKWAYPKQAGYILFGTSLTTYQP